MYFTITFRSFTPQPGGLEFRPGQDYYFICKLSLIIGSCSFVQPSNLHHLLIPATSSRDDLHRRVGGRCSTHNMKVVFKVCCHPGESSSKSESLLFLPSLTHAQRKTNLLTLSYFQARPAPPHPQLELHFNPAILSPPPSPHPSSSSPITVGTVVDTSTASSPPPQIISLPPHHPHDSEVLSSSTLPPPVQIVMVVMGSGSLPPPRPDSLHPTIPPQGIPRPRKISTIPIQTNPRPRKVSGSILDKDLSWCLSSD